MKTKPHVKDGKEKYRRNLGHLWHHEDTVLALKCLSLDSLVFEKNNPPLFGQTAINRFC